MTGERPARRHVPSALAVALAGALLLVPVTTTANGAVPQPAAALKAAFIFNFAKFTEWPALPPGMPIDTCIVSDDAIAEALVETARGQHINGHAVEVHRLPNDNAWRTCHVIFVPDREIRRSAAALDGVKALPVLTVSDGQGFSQSDGIIELYVEDGRMRFAINVKAAGRSGLRLSSRLLGLARIVGGGHVP